MSKIVEEAQKRYKEALEYDADQREQRKEDIRFVRLGEQWPESVKRDRETPGSERPMLVINRLGQFRNQVANEIRQNCPSIKVRPVDDKADIKTANIYNGLMRSIQEQCDAATAYETAVESAIDTGLGYFRIYTDYCDSESFDQHIIIDRIVDTAAVFFDIDSTKPDGSDAKWAIIIDAMSKDEVEEKYPDIDQRDWVDSTHEFVKKDYVIVSDYYYFDTKEKTLCLMQDGGTALKSEIPKELYDLIVRERKVTTNICKIAKIIGDKVTEESEMLCSYIPVIPVIGLEAFIDGKRYLKGLTRDAKDPARLYNYMESANAEALSLAPKSPYIAAIGQTEGFEHEWQIANRLSLSVLHYNPIDVMGNVLPPPRREPPPGANMGFEAAMNRSAEDIKSVMGIYDASLGNREGTQSGVAIRSQMKQANMSTFHFSSNLARSIKHAGRIIIELIPSIYDTERTIRTIGEDGQPSSAKINPNAEQSVNDGDIFNLNVGKYDVVADIGPTYATKRQEAFDSQVQMAQADPTLMQIGGDIILGNADWPGADDLAKRKKAMLPPPILALIKSEETEGSGKDIDPEIEQQMNQMADQVEHLSQALKEAQSQAESKEDELDIKRFEAQTKRLEVEHKIALESVGEFHRIANESVAATLQQPNNGTLEDEEEPKEQEPKTEEVLDQ